MRGIDGSEPYGIVAAATGRVRIIVDGFTGPERNNHVWLEHPNGEWTKFRVPTGRPGTSPHRRCDRRGATLADRTPESVIAVRTLGGATDRFTADESAYPHRGARFNVSFDAAWSNPDDDRMVRWSRERGRFSVPMPPVAYT